MDTAFLERPGGSCHAVQLYESDELLFDAVGRFLGAGLTTGERLLVIAHPDHTKGILARIERELPAHAARALSSRQLVCLDASAVLAEIMIGGKPNAGRFHDVVGQVLCELAGDVTPAPRMRAYGEMVDLVWRTGNFTGAIEVERLWNEAGDGQSFELLCAYLVGHFYKEQRTAHIGAI